MYTDQRRVRTAGTPAPEGVAHDHVVVLFPNPATGTNIRRGHQRIQRGSEIFARRGLNIDFGGSFILPRIVGMQKAKELVLLADILDAERAQEMGLVNRVVPQSELDTVVEEFVSKLKAGPPIALAASKKLLNQSFTSTLEEALEAEGLGQAYQFTTADTVEAMMAFVEKRAPRFTGR